MIRLLLVLLVAFIAAGESALAAIPSSVEIVCDVDRAAFVRAARDQSAVTFRLWTAETGFSQVGGDYVVAMTDLVAVRSSVQTYDGVRRRSFLTLRSNLAGPVNLGTAEVWLDVSVGTTKLTCDYGLHRNPALAFPPPARKKLEAVAFARESSHSETCDECAVTTDTSARVSNSTYIPVPTGDVTVVTFDSERWDTAEIHDTTANSSRLTAPTTGNYLIFAHINFDGGGGVGFLRINIQDGSGNYLASQTTDAQLAGQANGLSVVTHHSLNAGDYVELTAFNGTGMGDVRVVPCSSHCSDFGMVKLP